jgi:hypothetical protein
MKFKFLIMTLHGFKMPQNIVLVDSPTGCGKRICGKLFAEWLFAEVAENYLQKLRKIIC